jgi:FtsP/CotA-like multicopper oxidase with cupredoxin domain
MMNQTTANGQAELFTTDTSGLPEMVSPGVIRLHDKDQLDLRIGPVRKTIDGADLRMLAYNGSVPGPNLHVDQGSAVNVQVRNDGDVEATVHWHGLRLDNRYDGVPHETQAPIPIGDTFTYQLQFPDPGFYWYHPHIREDYGLEMGLYGTIVVEPANPEYWPTADRQLTLTLDDLLVEDGHIAPFRRSGPTFVAMGRFGNVMLINGETEFSGEASVGEVVRLYVVNTANTRIFNFALLGARAKLVGGDSGRYERETFIDEVLLAPSERAVIDVLFDTPGQVILEHRTPDHIYDLGAFTVTDGAASHAAGSFEVLRTDPELTAEHQAIGHHLERTPDKILGFYSLMPLLYGAGDTSASTYACPMHPEVTATQPGTCPRCGMSLVAVLAETSASTYACPMHPEVTATQPGTCPRCGMRLVAVLAETSASTYACPMHPEVTATEPGTCPQCGMRLVAVLAETSASYACPMHPEVTATEPGTCPQCGMRLVASDALPQSAAEPGRGAAHGGHDHGDGLEWEDQMLEINRASDPTNMIWQLIDRETGATNGDIAWAFTVGDQVKIRLVNQMDSDHPMHHPFHIHGAGRFLILSRDDKPEANLVWKDTVLVRAGETVDILLDVSNPGLWMAHCHIAEHNQGGMMFSFNVAPGREQAR